MNEVQILTTNSGVVLDHGVTIEFGIWDEPNLEKWKIVKDAYFYYYVDCNFKVFTVDSVPEDFREMKYIYSEEEGFTPNPNYCVEDSSDEEPDVWDEMAAAIQEGVNEV